MATITAEDLQNIEVDPIKKGNHKIIKVVYKDKFECAVMLVEKYKMDNPLIIDTPPQPVKGLARYVNTELDDLEMSVLFIEEVVDPEERYNANNLKIFSSRDIKNQVISKINIMFHTAYKYGHKCIIIGHWGQQSDNPLALAKIYKDVLECYDVDHVFFSLNSEWYEVFKKIFN